MGNAGVSTTRLNIGEVTSRGKPKTMANGTIRVIGSVMLPVLTADGETVGERKEIRGTGKNIGEARAAVQAKGAELLRHAEEVIEEARTKVKKNRIDGMTVAEFIDTKCLPELAKKNYSATTLRSYRDKLDLVLNRCGRKGCNHAHTIADMTLAQVTYGDGAGAALKRCLEELAPLHGTATTKKVVSVLRTWFYGPLDLYSHRFTSPLDSAKFTKQLNLGDVKKIQRAPTGVALTKEEYEKALAWFLAVDPEEGTSLPKQGQYTKVNTAAAKRRGALTLTMLAAGTGARKHELQWVRWHEVTETTNGMMIHISHPKKDSSGRSVPRDCLVLDYRIEQYIRDLKDARDPLPTDYVVGAPTDPSKVWDDQAVSKVIRTRKDAKKTVGLYDQAAAELDIPKLTEQAFHIWRRTVENRMILSGVDESARVTQMGHGAAVAAKHYKDYSQFVSLVSAAKVARPALRAVK